MENNEFVDLLIKKTKKLPVPDSVSPNSVKATLLDNKPKPRKKVLTGISAAACIFLCLLCVYVWSHTDRDHAGTNGSTADDAVMQKKVESDESKVGEDAQMEPGAARGGIDEGSDLATDSYQSIKSLLLTNASKQNQYGTLESGVTDVMGGADGNEMRDTEIKQYNKEDKASSKDVQTDDYAKTNTQVQGIDEADVIKTDGEYLYTVKNRFESSVIVITKVKDGDMKVASEIDVTKNVYQKIKGNAVASDILIEEMYLDEERLIVLCNAYDKDAQKYITMNMVYGIADKKKPEMIDVLYQDGYYSTSRKSGNYIYTFSNYLVYEVDADSKEEEYVPRGKDGKIIPLQDILIPKEANDNSFLVVTAFDISDSTDFTSQKSIMAASNIFYVSEENVYATTPVYRYEGKDSKSQTQIIKVPYSDGQFGNSLDATVDGTLNNSFSMDEYNGYLRMVTHVVTVSDPSPRREDGVTGYEIDKDSSQSKKLTSREPYNSLFILDANLRVTGSVRNLAPNEDIYSARFFGDAGYFVTFRNVDPLFSVDLSNPNKPKVLGKLKIPGFSSYLHFYSKNRLLGIGMEVDEKTSEQKGLKISMFDISNPSDVKEVDQLVLDEFYYSPALYNHKAVMIDTVKNLFGFMAVGNRDEWDGRYLLFSYRRGFIKEASYNVNKLKGDTYGARGLYIGDFVYVYVPGGGIQSYSLKTNQLVDTVYF